MSYRDEIQQQDSAVPSHTIPYHTIPYQFVEINDMGKHVISIYNGAQFICSVLILNLTVESLEPTCLTVFDEERKKIQMTCQWVQVIEGEQAHLISAGNRVIYAHETLNINVDGRFNLTNKFSVDVETRDIFDERTLPDKCVILNQKQNEEKQCKFPPVERYTIQDAKTENVSFQCCTANKNISFTSWYIVDDEVIPISFTEDIFITASDPILFLCGEEKNKSNSMLLYSMGSVDVGMGSFYTISVSDRNPFSNSTDGKLCHTISVNVSRNTSISLISEETNPTQVASSKPMLTDATTEESKNTCTCTSTSLIVSLTIVSAISFSLTMYVCFINIRGFYWRRMRPKLNVEINSSPAAGDDATESLELTNISSAPSQPRRDLSPDTIVEEQHGTGNAIIHACQESQHGPLSYFQGEFGQMDNRSIAHTRNNHEQNEVKNRHSDQRLRETEHPSTGTADSIQIGGARPTVVVPSAPFQDSTYCSLDDVKGTPSNTGIAFPMTFQSSSYPSYGQTDHSDLYNVIGDKRPYAVERKDGRNDATANRSGPTKNVDELYAKPDMSRKTKKIAVLESDYDDPRVPGDDFYWNASYSVVNNSQIYSNSVANTPDEMNCDGILYLNESVHSSF